MFPKKGHIKGTDCLLFKKKKKYFAAYIQRVAKEKFTLMGFQGDHRKSREQFGLSWAMFSLCVETVKYSGEIDKDALGCLFTARKQI